MGNLLPVARHHPRTCIPKEGSRVLHHCAEDDSLLLRSRCRRMFSVLAATSRPFGSYPSLRPPQTHIPATTGTSSRQAGMGDAMVRTEYLPAPGVPAYSYTLMWVTRAGA